MQTHEQRIEACRNAIERIRSNPAVFEHELVATVTYFVNPKTDKWTMAPGHANRIDVGRYGRQITFGANSFLVELCVKRGLICVSEFLAGPDYTDKAYQILYGKLNYQILGSVSNFQGKEFPGIYPLSKEMMRFGNAGIFLEGARFHILNSIGIFGVIIK